MADDLAYAANASTPPLSISQRTFNPSGSLHIPYIITVKASASTITRTATSTTTAVLVAANTARLGYIIFNDAADWLYVKFGGTASASSFSVKLAPYQHYECPATVVYTGTIDGILASGTGDAQITEFTY